MAQPETYFTNYKEQKIAFKRGFHECLKSSLTETFLEASLCCGIQYLSCGGPTSRLEEQLNQAGEKYGLELDVFATPTSLMISAYDPYSGKTHSVMKRVKDLSVNLDQLKKLDHRLHLLAEGKKHPRLIIQSVNRIICQTDVYSNYTHWAAIFMLGFSVCLLRYNSWEYWLLGGFATLAILSATTPLQIDKRINRLFSDFISGCLAFVAAGICQYFIGAGTPAALGTIIILVPGLMLTSAMSEITEHNFLSGTIKLIRASFTVVALGLSYLLIQQLLAHFGLDKHLVESNLISTLAPNSAIQSYIAAILVILSSSVIFKVPKKLLPGSTLAGFVGWVSLDYFSSSETLVLASFLASTIVGIISLSLGKFYKVPSQIFSVPGILILVPGLLALSSFHFINDLDKVNSSMITGLQALLMASAIAFGLLSARLPFVYFKKSSSTL